MLAAEIIIKEHACAHLNNDAHYVTHVLTPAPTTQYLGLHNCNRCHRAAPNAKQTTKPTKTPYRTTTDNTRQTTNDKTQKEPGAAQRPSGAGRPGAPRPTNYTFPSEKLSFRSLCRIVDLEIGVFYGRQFGDQPRCLLWLFLSLLPPLSLSPSLSLYPSLLSLSLSLALRTEIAVCDKLSI